MTSTNATTEKAHQRYAWIFLFVLEILLALNILIVIVESEGPAIFEADTGVAWAEFAAAYPTVATAYRLEQRLAYMGYLSLALFALFVTYFAFRQGRRWAWYALWVLPGTLALTAVLLALSDQPGLGAYYGGFAIVVLIGLLLPIRIFFPKVG
jgi:hypothetical protein